MVWNLGAGLEGRGVIVTGAAGADRAHEERAGIAARLGPPRRRLAAAEPLTVDEVTEDDRDFQVDTNLKTMFFPLPARRQRQVRPGPRGRIITFSSQG